MLTVSFKASFLRQMNKLDEDLQGEAIEKIDLLKDIQNHQLLKVHKLHGPLTGTSSFSVNYKTRIVFQYVSKTEVALLSIGDHDIYN
ncbi:MAG: type II toxin-antitoxin system mRNA interferase toxin, RelE/StbE family [Candidatus Kaiserbacteria bacterium]|nr:type II toxin-antitoxin system mRNA interferase toxin, RelE/StbE family [Candidatus Kaiserbacteria bacterium]